MESNLKPDPARPLAGRVALITGASRGIGLATARLLAERGADVVLNGIGNPEALAEEARALEASHGITAMAIAADIADETQVSAMYRQVQSRFKRLDILVNNAGILGDAMVGMISEAMMARTLGVNVAGSIRNLQMAARLMRRHGGGSVISVSSIIGRAGNPGQVVYGASKAAIIGMTLSAAKELGPQNIRVNAVAPGYIDTDMISHLTPEVHQERVCNIAMGRVGTAGDVARAIAFLASDDARYITGQVIGVDGGMVI